MIASLPHVQTLVSNPESLVYEVVECYGNVESAKRDARKLEELICYWEKRTKELAQNPTVWADLPDLLSVEWLPVLPIAYIVLKGSWDKRIVEAQCKFKTTKNPELWVTFVNMDFILPLNILLKSFDQFIALSESNHSPKPKVNGPNGKDNATPIAPPVYSPAELKAIKLYNEGTKPKKIDSLILSQESKPERWTGQYWQAKGERRTQVTKKRPKNWVEGDAQELVRHAKDNSVIIPREKQRISS